MHFVCSTFGSAGDVFPMLGLALELRSRGHEVTFATNEHFAETVGRHGLPFESLGNEQQYAACINHPDLWHPRRAFGHLIRTLQQVWRRHYELHEQWASSSDTVAITNCFGLGALMAQEKFGLPVITLHCQPAVLWSDVQPPTLPGVAGPRWLKSLLYRAGERFIIQPEISPFLNGWRKELGLPPVSRITQWWHSPYGVLCLFPYWYGPPQVDWPGNLLQTDFPLWNDSRDADLQPEIERFWMPVSRRWCLRPVRQTCMRGPSFRRRRQPASCLTGGEFC